MKQSSMSATGSRHHALVSALLLMSLCLLRGAAASLLSSPSSGGGSRHHLPAAAVRLPAPSTASSRPELLQHTPTSPRRALRHSDPRAPRADLTLTLGGRLLLSRQAHSENSLSGPPLSRDDPVQPLVPDYRGQVEAPEPADGAAISAVAARHSRARLSLTTEQQSRRLPPEFLSFPVYRSNALDGRRAGGGGGGGRKPALESPLAEQIVTTTAAPRRRATTPQPSPATPTAAVELILPAPPAGCDAPGGPSARLASHCRALRQLRQQTQQQRRRTAQRQAQRQLQRLIDLHLAGVAARAQHLAPLELSRRQPAPTREAGTGGPRGTLTQRPSEQSVEDATLLKARNVPPLPIPPPQTVTKASPSLEKRRHRHPQGPQPVSAAALGTVRPGWVPVRVSAAVDGRGGDRPETGSSTGGDRPETGSSAGGDRPETGSSTGRPKTGEAGTPPGRFGGQSRWRTYSSVSPNSIRTAPDKLDKPATKAIRPLPTKPVPLFTTTIVPVGGMPITQKGVIPGLLDIPARVYFTCRHKQPGFYGNPQTGCQVYHQCTVNGKKYDYLCGVGTAFNAETNTCDHWYNTSCDRN